MHPEEKVLDHGFVRLVSFTQPEKMIMDATGAWVRDPKWTGDLEIIRNARVSFDADWRTGEDAEKDSNLMHRLWNDQHSTPFEAMTFTFEVKAPIFVFRQWHRHRTWTYNELSGRYGELPAEFYVPDHDQIKAQSKANKQGREGDLPFDLIEDFRAMIQLRSQSQFDAYKFFLSRGVARELARLVLPLNTYSRMFASVDLRNLFHFLELRLDSHAQYEIRVYAEAILELIRDIVPVAVHAFEAAPKRLTAKELSVVGDAIDNYLEDFHELEDDVSAEEALSAKLLESAAAKLFPLGDQSVKKP